MAKPRIVILGAGLGGAIAAFEIKQAVGDKAQVEVVSQGDTFHFVPSNPWVAVHWRKREAIEVKLPPVFQKKGIAFRGVGAAKVMPERNQLELTDGILLDYDYLVIATGPELAFDEIPGLGPHGGFTQSVCHVDHAEAAANADQLSTTHFLSSRSDLPTVDGTRVLEAFTARPWPPWSGCIASTASGDCLGYSDRPLRRA